MVISTNPSRAETAQIAIEFISLLFWLNPVLMRDIYSKRRPDYKLVVVDGARFYDRQRRRGLQQSNAEIRTLVARFVPTIATISNKFIMVRTLKSYSY